MAALLPAPCGRWLSARRAVPQAPFRQVPQLRASSSAQFRSLSSKGRISPSSRPRRCTVARRGRQALAATAFSVPAADLPNPFAHERSDTNQHDSLRAAVWEVLKSAEGGLESDAIVDAVQGLGNSWKLEDGAANAQKVQQLLQDTIYFVPADTRLEGGKPVGDSPKWTLAVLRPLRWGIVGNGLIGEDVVSVMDMLPGTEIVAVGARKEKKDAEDFGKKHGGRNFYGKFEEVADDSECDAAYVNAIHITHKDLAVAMLKGGKHVLSEKPIAIHANLARDMIKTATEKDLFLTEGLWSRFFPASQKVRQLVNQGAIGEVKNVKGQICIEMTDTKRLYDLEMGGGGLLDIGLYVISIASWIYGGKRPDAMDAFGVLADTGADVAGSVTMRYGDSAMADLYYSIEFDAPIEVTVFGTKGRIIIHNRAHNPEALTLITTDEEGNTSEQRMEFPNPPKPDAISHGDADGGFNFPGSMGFIWQSMAVHSAILKGRKEMDDITHKETVMLMELCDQLRESEHLPVSYPQDACKDR